MTNDFEETDIIKILQVFGIFRNSLPKEHSDFVRVQLQKVYDTVTKTFVLGGKEYKGTYREDSHRKDNKEAYAKESKLATVLASFGFDVILIEEKQKIRAAYKKQPQSITPDSFVEHHKSTTPSVSAEHCHNKYTSETYK